jgi:hypothetical protein
MSYTEYLNRKKASAPIILDTRPKMDASTFTRHTRVTAAGNVRMPTKKIVGNINEMRMSSTRDNNSVKAGVQVTAATGVGGKVPDASSFSDYVAGLAAEKDYKDGPPGTTKVVLNANPASVPGGMTSISSCNWDATSIGNRTFPIATLTALNKDIPANLRNPEFIVAKTGSQVTRNTLECFDKAVEPHSATGSTPVQKGIHQFVDDTISLNSGTFRIGTGSATPEPSATGNGRPGNPTGSTPESSGRCPPANHNHPEINRRATWSPRPTKGAGGLFAYAVSAPQEHQFKVGGLVPSDHPKYVEKHHGNDWGVNPRRVPIPYQIPAGSPAHLKINDPKPTV